MISTKGWQRLSTPLVKAKTDSLVAMHMLLQRDLVIRRWWGVYAIWL